MRPPFMSPLAIDAMNEAFRESLLPVELAVDLRPIQIDVRQASADAHAQLVRLFLERPSSKTERFDMSFKELHVSQEQLNLVA